MIGMLGRKKKKSVLGEEYKAILEAFAMCGDMPNASRSYSDNWLSFDSVKEFIKASHKVCGAYPIVFHIDTGYSGWHRFFFFKEGIMYVIEVKKWREVDA